MRVGRKFWPVRNIALNRMKTINKCTEKILVLNDSLELINSTIAPVEVMIRI